MFSTNPQLNKKHSLQRKSTHIHFDASNEIETEEDGQESLVDQILKRQTRMMEEEKHEKIVKKPKMDQTLQKINFYGQDARFNRPVHKQQQRFLQEQKSLESKSVELLRQLLIYSNPSQNTLINSQIANRWILERSTPTKIKSFLALYMILYQFENIEFVFSKTINLDGPEFKTIEIQEIKNKQRATIENITKDGSEHQKPDYSAFKANQMTKYLGDYLEWLIWENQQKFESGPGDVQFWAMALNNCEKTAMQLIRSGSHRQRQRNVFLSLFLMNSSDVVFRSTLQVPTTERNIIYMTQEDLSILPKCHWLLGVNFSLRYFYKNNLEQRMKVSLDLESIDESQIGDFYHEYQLLSHYFTNETVKFSGVSLSDKALEWIAINSGCRNAQQDNVQKLDQKLVRQICSSLLVKVLDRVHDIRELEDKMLIVVQLLERDSLLKEDQKDRLLSSILYNEEKIAYKLGSQFSLVVSKLQHHKQAKLPHLSQRLTQEYAELYSHLILSQQRNIRNDLLAQLKHLTNIKIERLTEEVKTRIREIVTSFNLLTHWNKQVSKTFVFILEKYLQKLNKSVKNEDLILMEIETDDKSKKGGLRQEIQNLCSFLKIRLNLESMDMEKLRNIISLIQSAHETKTQLPFELRTVSFLKKDLLSILFSKNAFNQSLLSQIKKDFSLQREKGKSLLEQLEKIALGNKYFEEQIGLLKQEAQNLLIV